MYFQKGSKKQFGRYVVRVDTYVESNVIHALKLFMLNGLFYHNSFGISKDVFFFVFF